MEPNKQAKRQFDNPKTLEMLRQNQDALQYQGTIMIEILKNESQNKIDLLDKGMIESELLTALDHYIGYKLTTELKKKKYEPEKFVFAVDILHIHKDVYPFAVDCVLYFLQRKGKKGSLKQEFF